MIKVLFFGKLSDLVKTQPMVVDDYEDLKSLCFGLSSLDAVLGGAIVEKTTRVAVNHTFVSGNVTLSPNDEVAFMSPLSGG